MFNGHSEHLGERVSALTRNKYTPLVTGFTFPRLFIRSWEKRGTPCVFATSCFGALLSSWCSGPGCYARLLRVLQEQDTVREEKDMLCEAKNVLFFCTKLDKTDFISLET